MAATKSLRKKPPCENRSKDPLPSAVVLNDGSSQETTGLHFVVSTGVEKPNPEMRKLIRSRVMLGKNRGKALTPTEKKPKVLRELLPANSDPSFPSASDLDGDLPESSASSTVTPEPVPIPIVAIPRKCLSGLSTIRLADTLESGAIEGVLHLSSIAKQLLFPLESCIFFDKRAENWIAPLALDPAFLHARIFMAQFYFEALESGIPSFISRRSLPHFLKTIKLLRERMLSDVDEARLSDSTIAAIMVLVGHAHLTGDSKSAKHHMEGLYKIVLLRGGVVTFEKNTKLLVEILRNDIGIALHNGSKPIFFKNSTRDAFPPYPDLIPLVELTKPLTAKYQHASAMPLDDLDAELAQAWKVMSDFNNIINYAVDSELRISTETFLDTMASVFYRLLNTHFEIGSKNEAIRLGLLAFLSSVFLQWKHLGMPYPHLTSMFRNCFAGMVIEGISSELMIWLLMVGAVTVFDETDDGWLKPLLHTHIESCGVREWSEVHGLLIDFLWISLVYDKPGKRVFESAISWLEIL